jgi:AraC-like DNA-binding protein/mannose-6-phosphate isomerase-like protein (cupin superfamily)
VWADIERFGIDQLIAADPDDGRPSRPRAFAVQLPQLGPIDVHWHDYYELGYVLDGRATHVVNGVAQRAEPGSVFLLSPADFHAIEPVGDLPLRMVNAVLHPELVERTLESVVPVGEIGLPWIAAEASPAVAADVCRIRDETARRAPGWDVLVEAALRAVVVELARSSADGPAVPDDREGSGPPAHLRRAVRYVEQHFREPLTLAQVAAVAHLSPHWFSEQFRRATGHSFQTFLKQRRLQFARALLESTDLDVTEVCHAAGFNDPSYFGRAFRAHFGTPPSARKPRRG